MYKLYHQIRSQSKKIPYKRISLAVYGLSYAHFFFWPFFYVLLSYIPWLDGATLEAFLWAFVLVVGYFHYVSGLNYWVRMGIRVLRWKRNLYA